MKIETIINPKILGEKLGSVYNTSINLRKVKKIMIEEKYGIHYPRPQQHVLLIANYGLNKSTLLKILYKLLKEDMIIVDDTTKPALLGTITRDSKYVEGVISKASGKVLGIDEWDSLNYYAQKALLSPLENQTINRTLGFSVKKPIMIQNGSFKDMKIEGGFISGKIQFTCLAMSYSFDLKTKAQFALSSRFKIIRVNAEREDMKKISKGLFNYDFIDRNQTVDSVLVKEKSWVEYVDFVYDYLKENVLFPQKEALGFVNRTIIDNLRSVIGNMIIDNPQTEYVINSSELLIKGINDVTEQLSMYTIESPTKYRLIELLDMYPDKNYTFYTKKLGISKTSYYRYMAEIEDKIKLSEIEAIEKVK